MRTSNKYILGVGKMDDGERFEKDLSKISPKTTEWQ